MSAPAASVRAPDRVLPSAWLKRAATLLFLGTLAIAPIVAGTFDAFAQAAVTGVVLAAAALHLAARRVAGARECLATPLDLPILLLVAAALLSLLFSVNRHASAAEFLRLLSCVAAFWLAAEAVYGSVRVWGCGGAGAGSGPHGPASPLPAEGRAAEGSEPRVSHPLSHGKRRRRAAARAGKAGRAESAGPVSPALDGWMLALDRPGMLLWGALVAGPGWVAARGVQEYLAALREGFPAWRVFGGFSHPSTLIAYLGLTLPLAIAAAVALRSRPDSLRAAWPVPALVSLLSLAAAAFTASRLGTLALGLGLLLFVVAYLTARRSVTPAQAAAIAVGLALLGAAVVLAVPTLRYRFLAALSGAEAFSLQFRFTTWHAAWRIFLDHPLTGSGIGTFASIMTRYSETSYSQTAHNHFAQTAAETGIIGIGALLALLVLWLAALVRGIRGTGDEGRGTGDGGPGTGDGGPETGDESGQSPSPPHPLTLSPPHPVTPSPRHALMAAALAGVAASAVFAFVDFGWSIPATGLALWALMGAGVAAAGAVRSRPARAGVETAALLVLCLALAADGLLLLGSLHFNRGIALRDASLKAAAEGDPQRSSLLRTEAAGELIEALRFDPYAPEAHWELGRLVGGTGLATGDRARIEEGLRHLEEAGRLAPTAALYHYHLGLLAMRAGETERAAAAFRRALEWDPNSPPTWRKYGLLCERWRPAETLKAARRLVAVEASLYGTLNPLEQRVELSYAFGHYWLAEEKRKAGDRPGARAEYEKALTIIERYRESLKGIGGIGRDGESAAEPDPDCDPLEKAVRRGLAET